MLVTHLFPYPPVRGVELRIFKLMKWLSGEGYRVILVLPGEREDEQICPDELRHVVHEVCWRKPALRTRLGRTFPRLRRMIWENAKPIIRLVWLPNDGPVDTNYAGIPSVVGDEGRKRGVSSPHLAHLVAKLARKYKPVGVIAEYIFLTDCYSFLKPEVLKIVDTIDVFSLKEKQVVSYGIADPWNCTPDEERAYLLRSDVIVAIQDEEAAVLRRLVPERELITIGIDFDVDAAPAEHQIEPNKILVVGSDNPLNVHGLKSFFENCWSEIKLAHPGATLDVVGLVGPLCRIDDASVNYTTRAEDLTALYRQAHVVINPTMAGTGLKIKSVEALAHGKPLVAWPHGVDGLAYDGAAPYVMCESWKEFAAAVIHLLQATDEARTLGRRALEYAQTKFATASVYAPLKARLTQQSMIASRENFAAANVRGYQSSAS